MERPLLLPGRRRTLPHWRARVHGGPEAVAQGRVPGPGPVAGAGSRARDSQSRVLLLLLLVVLLLLLLRHEVSRAGTAAGTRAHARHAEPRMLRLLRQLSCDQMHSLKIGTPGRLPNPPLIL